MICLTGDIHHMGMKTRDQDYLSGTEAGAALRFMDIAERYGLKATLFATGKLFRDETDVMEELIGYGNLEIGGHNYYAFKPRLPFKISKRVAGLANGPYFYQSYEVSRTIRTITEATGKEVVSWRNHGYRNDCNTEDILAKQGIRFYSDEVALNRWNPYTRNGLTIVPINILPDHDFISHGGLTAEPELITADQWLEIVKGQIDTIAAANGIATILAHPACMEIVDDFITFRRLARHISQYKSLFMREMSSYSYRIL